MKFSFGDSTRAGQVEDNSFELGITVFFNWENVRDEWLYLFIDTYKIS